MDARSGPTGGSIIVRFPSFGHRRRLLVGAVALSMACLSALGASMGSATPAAIAQANVTPLMVSAPPIAAASQATAPAGGTATAPAAPSMVTAPTAAPAAAPSMVTTPTAAPVTSISMGGDLAEQMDFARGQLGALTAKNDCTLSVPLDPASAEGLATPYVLANGNDGTVCTESNQTTAAFVQAIILDPATGQVTAYDPVVEDANSAATAPPVPVLPADAIVAVWTGFNGNVLKLTGLGANQFDNFAQQSYDNSPALFSALNLAAGQGMLTIPPLGNANDGRPCPSLRDFSVVDQDQSDNVPVAYGAPFNVSNGSDDQLISNIDQALGCGQWLVPLLSSPGQMTTTGPTDEVQAAKFQGSPVALVPAGDEFTTNNGQFLPPVGAGQADLPLVNLYRAEVGQPPTFDDQDTVGYCTNLAIVGAPRLWADAVAEERFPAPAFAMIGTNLANVLAMRFVTTYQNLNCAKLTGFTDPIRVVVNGNDVAVAAVYGSAKVIAPADPPVVKAAGLKAGART